MSCGPYTPFSPAKIPTDCADQIEAMFGFMGCIPPDYPGPDSGYYDRTPNLPACPWTIDYACSVAEGMAGMAPGGLVWEPSIPSDLLAQCGVKDIRDYRAQQYLGGLAPPTYSPSAGFVPGGDVPPDTHPSIPAFLPPAASTTGVVSTLAGALPATTAGTTDPSGGGKVTGPTGVMTPAPGFEPTGAIMATEADRQKQQMNLMFIGILIALTLLALKS